MAIKALSTDDVIRYVCEDDPGKGTSDETVWLLGLIPTRDLARLRDRATTIRGNPTDMQNSDLQIQINSNEAAIEYLKLGLKGWENFQDAKTGEPIEFKTTAYAPPGGGKSRPAISDNLIDLIPHKNLMEVGNKIAMINTMEEDTVKKSGESE